MDIRSYKIILVDDDPAMLGLHSSYLEQQGYDVISAVDGRDALNKIAETKAEIGLIISDVVMPVMDGYEFCKELKENSNTAKLPVIFISALSSLEEKLKGYAAGADDYITKPIDEKELYEKSKRLIERRQYESELNQSTKASQSMALEALTFSSELGQVIEFYKKMWTAQDYKQLAGYLFDMVKNYELICTLQIHMPNKVLNFCDNGVVSPLEANVIELARKKQRFFDFGSRTIINYHYFSLLIKNMPIDEPEKYGRLKDVFGMIANGLDEKIKQLNSDLLTEQKQEIIKSIRDSLGNIEQSLDEVQKQNILSIEDLNDDISEAITVLCLQEFQEENIQKIVAKCLDRVNKSFYKALNIRENLTNINEQFHTVLGI